MKLHSLIPNILNIVMKLHSLIPNIWNIVMKLHDLIPNIWNMIKNLPIDNIFLVKVKISKNEGFEGKESRKGRGDALRNLV